MDWLSIIIPCWNQLEFTRKCVAALMRQTGGNWELIVVDNGSNDGTGDYLAGVQDASPVPVTLIANATNRGFPAAINQGLEYARVNSSFCSITTLLLPRGGWGSWWLWRLSREAPRRVEFQNRRSGLWGRCRIMRRRRSWLMMCRTVTLKR